MVKSKKHRLVSEFYTCQIVSFTICFMPPSEAAKDNIFKSLNDLLITTLKSNECLLHIWVLMPDHCHMIIGASNEQCDILKTVDKFKQESGFWFYQDRINLKWQTSYYDHIVRDDEDLMNQVYYILNNPVRKGIVEHWKDYPYKSSMIYNLDEL